MRARMQLRPNLSVSTRTKVMLRSAAIGVAGGVLAASAWFVVSGGLTKFKAQTEQTETAVTDSLQAMTTLEPIE